ncbi:MAG: S1C family serine protease [Maioricimonas sp. JB045]
MHSALLLPARVLPARAWRVVLPALVAATIGLTGAPRPAAAADLHYAIRTTQQRVVKIFGAGGIANLHSYGTGFLVSDEGHIVTVWSHVLDGDVVTVVLNDGRRFYGKVLGAEPQLDLAVLKIDATDLPYFDLDQAATASPGSRVLGFGNLVKVATGDEPASVLHGVIAAVTKLTARRGRYEVPYDGPVYIVDAVTNNPGSAGGVLTTWDGQLLGMIGRELRDTDSHLWINYAIPIGELRDAIHSIRTGDFTPREEEEPDDNPQRYVATDFGIVLVPDVVYRTPAYVDDVLPGSAASQVGLQPDDLIVFVNGELVHSIRTLAVTLGRLEAEDDLRLIIRRGKALIPVEMRVPRREELQ